MNSYYTLLTTIGQAKIATAIASGAPLNLTTFKVGDGNYTPSAGQNSLVSQTWSALLSSVTPDAENLGWVVAEAVIPPEVGGFYIREVGIFDNDGDLIAIAKFPETYKPVLAEGSAKDLFLRIIIEVGNAASVQLSVDPSLVLATKEYVGDVVAPLTAGMEEALARSGWAQKRFDDLTSRIFSQSVVTIKNKRVRQGFVLTRSAVRYLDLSQTGAVGSGSSIAEMDGRAVVLPDDALEVPVPQNASIDAMVRYVYLVGLGAGDYGVLLGETVPDMAMLLYTVTIPAGNTSNDISAVALTDNRVVAPVGSFITTADPYVYVALQYPLPTGQDYDVMLSVEAATNLAAVGSLRVYDKQSNGFKIGFTGSADNVQVRYTVMAINRK